MNRIEARFEQLKQRGETAFIPFITAGDPDLAASEQVVLALAEAGADVIEFGVPFSDPVGDGPVIQEASMRALKHGITLKDVLGSVKRVREQSDVPILLFSYYNPILAYGVEQLAADMADAGADGLLCVDLPPEEGAEYKAALDAHGLCTVFLTAPTTTDARLAVVSERCTGFVYYVSQMGVTGERASVVADLEQQVSRIKRLTAKPVAVGFGISTPEHARHVAGIADGVVVGSALVRFIGAHGSDADLARQVHDFAKPLADAAKGR
ncbi:MAG: tryptophan synthase subunit alpha [Candidatus Hydrogenedens sp.]|nr:tryptophan synthase subunit alpha [Candidatus Hydrogenedens sp.]